MLGESVSFKQMIAKQIPHQEHRELDWVLLLMMYQYTERESCFDLPRFPEEPDAG